MASAAEKTAETTTGRSEAAGGRGGIGFDSMLLLINLDNNSKNRTNFHHLNFCKLPFFPFEGNKVQNHL